MTGASTQRHSPSQVEGPSAQPDAGLPSLTLHLSYGDTPLGFVRSGSVIYLIARERSAGWPVELLRTGNARFLLSAVETAGSVALVTNDEERDRVFALFLEKYGPLRFRRWYDHPARVLRVDLTQVIPDEQRSARYYTWLEAEFDNVAVDYDRHIMGNRMNRLLRDRSLARMLPAFRRSSYLLEIGCGSGIETIPLLKAGHEILAIDVSDRMLEVTAEKARREGLGERLSTRRLVARDLAMLTAEVGTSAFDGAYSTYGALNCEPDLAPLPPALHGLLRDSAPFLAGVYNRWCLFELVGYFLTLKWDRAVGRRAKPVPVGASRFCVDIFAYSPGEFTRLFAPWFRTLSREGVPVALPPSDLSEYAERFSRHFNALARSDAWLGRRWPFCDLGDHFLMTLERRPLS